KRGPKIQAVETEGRDRSDARDGNSAIHGQAGAFAAAFLAAISLSTPSTTSRTVRINFAESSGISIENSSSTAKTILIPSSESIFNSSKVLSILTDSTGMCCVFAMTAITRSAVEGSVGADITVD